MKQSREPATIESVAQTLDRLLRHVEALDRDMQNLTDRIVPYDDQKPTFVSRGWLDPRPTEINLETLYEKIRQADRHIQNIERDFSAVRSTIDSLDKDAILRDELKPYLRPPTGRGRR
jgi:prefoldin subunit 5